MLNENTRHSAEHNESYHFFQHDKVPWQKKYDGNERIKFSSPHHSIQKMF